MNFPYYCIYFLVAFILLYAREEYWPSSVFILYLSCTWFCCCGAKLGVLCGISAVNGIPISPCTCPMEPDQRFKVS